MICWVCRSPMVEAEATAAATGLPRHLRANEGSRIHLRCHGEWKNMPSQRGAAASDLDALISAKKRTGR